METHSFTVRFLTHIFAKSEVVCARPSLTKQRKKTWWYLWTWIHLQTWPLTISLYGPSWTSASLSLIAIPWKSFRNKFPWLSWYSYKVLLQPLWNNCIIFIISIKKLSLWLIWDRFGLDCSWSALSDQKFNLSPVAKYQRLKFPWWAKAWVVLRSLRQKDRQKTSRRDGQEEKKKQACREMELSVALVQRQLHRGSVLMLIQPNGQQVLLCFSTRQLILREPSKEISERAKISLHNFSEPITGTRRGAVRRVKGRGGREVVGQKENEEGG